MGGTAAVGSTYNYSGKLNNRLLAAYERGDIPTAQLEQVNEYHTGALLGACAYTSTGKKYALICEMRLIKSAFFNAGILRTAANIRLTANMRLYVICA